MRRQRGFVDTSRSRRPGNVEPEGCIVCALIVLLLFFLAFGGLAWHVARGIAAGPTVAALSSSTTTPKENLECPKP